MDVRLEDADSDVTDIFYHGTAPENLESTLNGGLKSMNR